MAKINARGATEVARVNFTTEFGVTGILVLRSDRKVLRRFTGDTKTGYTILGTVRAERELGIQVLRNICEKKRGWTITKEQQ